MRSHPCPHRASPRATSPPRINWGDGTSSAGTVDGTAATSATVNGLYTINGTHTYGHPGAFHVTITVSATGTPSATTTTTLSWHR